MNAQEIEFEYDMATMDLQSKRYRAAEEKFKSLAMASNSPESWCGLGMAKYGLVMEHIGIEEVFYCFSKARIVDETQVAELEIIVIETSIDIVKNLYNVMLLTRQSINKAQIERANAAIATLAGTIMTARNNYKGRMLGTIAMGTLTAVSFDSYVKAGATIGELQSLYKQTQELISDVQRSLHLFIKQQTELVEKFDKILNETHTEVTITIPKKNEIDRLCKVSKRYKIGSYFFLAFVGISVADVIGEILFTNTFQWEEFKSAIPGILLFAGIGAFLYYKSNELKNEADQLRLSLDGKGSDSIDNYGINPSTIAPMTPASLTDANMSHSNQTKQLPPPLPGRNNFEHAPVIGSANKSNDSSGDYYETEFKKIADSNERYKGKWNMHAFFFSWVWCFYKGCWVHGLIILLSVFVTYGSSTCVFLGIGWCIILGMRGTWLYYNVKIKQINFPKSLF